MKRIGLFAIALGAMLAGLIAVPAFGAPLAFAWDAGENWPPGTTSELCSGGQCHAGISGTTYQADVPVVPGGIVSFSVRGVAAAGSADCCPVEPVGGECPHPLVLCPPSPWVAFTATVPAAPAGLWATKSIQPGNPLATHVNFYSNLNGDASGTSLAVASVAVQAGDVIFVGSKSEGATTTFTITDNAVGGSNTYTNKTFVHHTGTNDINGQCAYAIAKATETLTITQTVGAARPYRRIHVAVGRPGSGKAFVYDNEAAGQGSGTAPSAGSYATAGTGGYAFSIFPAYNPTSWTPGSGWSTASLTDKDTYSEYRVITAETSITGNATKGSTGNDAWIACSIAVKEQATSGSYSYTASGGLTTGGAATLKRTSAQQAIGGLTTGGAATASKSSPGSNSHTASGGLTTGGAATLKLVKTAAASGGLTTGGIGTIKRTSAQQAIGGLTTGGAATLKLVKTAAASGGLTTGGIGTIKRTSAQQAIGGLTTGGAATLKLVKTAAASGGLTTGGIGTIKRTSAQQAIGGLTTGGAATLKLVKTAAASGGLTTGGIGTIKRTSAQQAIGGLTTGGAATASKSSPGSNSHTASGGLTTGGAATLKLVKTAAASGGLTAGGAATAIKTTFLASVAASIMDGEYIEPGITVRQGLRLILAALAGKVSGADTESVAFRNVGDTRTRISATVDQHGNRAAVNYDLSDG